MDKYAIIKLKKEGLSNRKAAKLLSIDLKTVARYWNEYQEQQHLLQSKDIEPKNSKAKKSKSMV